MNNYSNVPVAYPRPTGNSNNIINSNRNKQIFNRQHRQKS